MYEAVSWFDASHLLLNFIGFLFQEPTVINPIELSPHNFLVYRFAIFLTEVVHHQIWRDAGRPLTILLASSLSFPVSTISHPFKRSYWFAPNRRTLYLRVERTDEVGDCALVLLHALANLRCVDQQPATGFDDRHPAFIREFYRLVRAVASQYFFSRATKPHQQPISLPIPRTMSASSSASFSNSSSSSESVAHVSELEFMLGVASTQQQRDNALVDYIDLRVGSSSSIISPFSSVLSSSSSSDSFDPFAPHALSARLSNFKSLLQSFRMQQRLREAQEITDLLQVPSESSLSSRLDAAMFGSDNEAARQKAEAERETMQLLRTRVLKETQTKNLDAIKYVVTSNRSSASSSSSSSSSQSSSISAKLAERERVRLISEQLARVESTLDTLHRELFLTAAQARATSERLLALESLKGEVLPATLSEARSELSRTHVKQQNLLQRIAQNERRLRDLMNEVNQ